MPKSAARRITDSSDVVMQPKDKAVTFTPVLPKVRVHEFGRLLRALVRRGRGRDPGSRQTQARCRQKVTS